MTEAILHALGMAFATGLEILPLILGFALSAIVQAVVSHRQIRRLLPDDRPAAIVKALALGAASSSCSYAAVALARSLFRKVADLTAAMVFEMASINLVLELSIIIAGLPGLAVHGCRIRSYGHSAPLSMVAVPIESGRHLVCDGFLSPAR